MISRLTIWSQITNCETLLWGIPFLLSQHSKLPVVFGPSLRLREFSLFPVSMSFMLSYSGLVWKTVLMSLSGHSYSDTSRRHNLTANFLWLLSPFHPLFCNGLQVLSTGIVLYMCQLGLGSMQSLTLYSLIGCSFLQWYPSVPKRSFSDEAQELQLSVGIKVHTQHALRIILVQKSVSCRFFTEIHDITSTSPRSWLGFQYQTLPPSCWIGKQSKQRTVGYYQGMCVIIAPLELSCCPGHCCGSQVPQLVRTVGCFPVLEANRVLSTMAVSPQGGGFQIRFCSGPLGTVSEAHSGFSNRDLRATALAYKILKNLLDNPDCSTESHLQIQCNFNQNPQLIIYKNRKNTILKFTWNHKGPRQPKQS